MSDIAFGGIAVIALIAFSMPLLLGLTPRLRLPTVVLEILAGALVGPGGLGLIRVDQAVEVVATVGLAFLLLLAGLELDLDRLRGPLLARVGLAFGLSLVLAVAVGQGLSMAGLAERPLFIAVLLSATALGIVVPVLKDSGTAATPFGQLVVAAGSVAEFGPILLLSVLFSREGASAAMTLGLIAGLALLAGAATGLILGVERRGWLTGPLRRLQDTSAQIRVRGAFFLLVGFVAVAQHLGVELILGAFVAGVVLRTVDRDERMLHPRFRERLEAVGFGVFAPCFFVASGLRLELGGLLANPLDAARIPLYLVALLVVRGLPAILYRPLLGWRGAGAAGLVQATSLGLLVVGVQLGRDLGQIGPATGSALVAAGLLSVALFPSGALALLGTASSDPRPSPERRPASDPIGCSVAAPAGR